jgi:hypothetical protein
MQVMDEQELPENTEILLSQEVAQRDAVII